MLLVPACEIVNRRGVSTQAEVRVSYWNAYAAEGMYSDLPQSVARRLKAEGSNVRGISSIVHQCPFVTAGVAVLEKFFHSVGGDRRARRDCREQ